MGQKIAKQKDEAIRKSQLETGTIKNSERVIYHALESENCKAKNETVKIKKYQVELVRDNYNQVESVRDRYNKLESDGVISYN